MPVAETQAGKGSLAYDHPQSVGAIGATGTTAADALAAEADVVIGVGTRYSDFTTGVPDRLRATPTCGSSTSTSRPSTRTSSRPRALLGDARRGLEQLDRGPRRLARPRGAHRPGDRAGAGVGRDRAARLRPGATGRSRRSPRCSACVNRLTRPQDVVVCAAGLDARATCTSCGAPATARATTSSTASPAWATRSPAGLGVKMAVRDAGEDRDVVVMVGDGSYLMMAQELVTAVQEGVKLIVVLVQNHGFASIGALSESLGSQRFGTRYRYRTATGLDGDVAARSTWRPTPPAWAPGSPR